MVEQALVSLKNVLDEARRFYLSVELKRDLEDGSEDDEESTYEGGRISALEENIKFINELLDREDKSELDIGWLAENVLCGNYVYENKIQYDIERTIIREWDNFWKSFAKDKIIKKLYILSDIGIFSDKLGKSLIKNKTIELLKIAGKHLSSDDLDQFYYLGQNASLKHFEIDTRRAEDGSFIIEIAKSLKTNTSLRSLFIKSDETHLVTALNAVNHLNGNSALKELGINVHGSFNNKNLLDYFMSLNKTQIKFVVIYDLNKENNNLRELYKKTNYSLVQFNDELAHHLKIFWRKFRREGQADSKKKEFLKSIKDYLDECFIFIRNSITKKDILSLLILCHNDNISYAEVIDVFKCLDINKLLLYAVESKDVVSIELLLMHGANPLFKNEYGKMAIDLAKITSERDILSPLYKQLNLGDKIMRYSEVDNRFSISEENWVISIARLPNNIHREHAFLIIEGQEFEEPVIWFIDLVRARGGNLDKGQWIPGVQGESKIRIYPYKGGNNLLHRCDKPMLKINTGDEILSESWSIPKEKAVSLIKEAEADYDHPPKFHILGQGNITTSSSSSADGHSCFTWAREKLHNLQDPRIRIPTDLIEKWIFSRTSRFLPGKANSSGFWKDPKIYYGVATALAVGAVAITYKESLPECKLM